MAATEIFTSKFVLVTFEVVSRHRRHGPLSITTKTQPETFAEGSALTDPLGMTSRYCYLLSISTHFPPTCTLKRLPPESKLVVVSSPHLPVGLCGSFHD